MGILQCAVCKSTAEASNREEAISLIDHASKSKKCNGKDENCVWYSNGKIPVYVPDGDIDPKRSIEGIKVKVSTKSAPQKSRK